MPDDQRIGTLIPCRGPLNQYAAKCATCEWSWTGQREQAEKHLRGHVSISHPPSIPIYREATS